MKEMRDTQGTTHQRYPEIFPETDEISDVTDTYPHIEPDVTQARNNRKIVRPTPAVRDKIYVTTRSLIAMTTIDINESAEQVCSTERPRRLSRNIRNPLRGPYVAV